MTVAHLPVRSLTRDTVFPSNPLNVSAHACTSESLHGSKSISPRRFSSETATQESSLLKGAILSSRKRRERDSMCHSSFNKVRFFSSFFKKCLIWIGNPSSTLPEGRESPRQRCGYAFRHTLPTVSSKVTGERVGNGEARVAPLNTNNCGRRVSSAPVVKRAC